MAGLSSLGLADNRIGDEGAQSLSDLVRHNDTLEKLVLSNNNIHDVGAGQLIAALSQNSSLKGLYLAGNTFGDSFGVRCSEVIGRLNHTLKYLDIRNTRLSRPAAQSVKYLFLFIPIFIVVVVIFVIVYTYLYCCC